MLASLHRLKSPCKRVRISITDTPLVLQSLMVGLRVVSVVSKWLGALSLREGGRSLQAWIHPVEFLSQRLRQRQNEDTLPALRELGLPFWRYLFKAL